MPLTTIDVLRPLLRCPVCGAPLRDDDVTCTNASCARARTPFLAVTGQPVLVDDTDSILDPAQVVPAAPRTVRGVRAVLAALGPKNRVAPRIAQRIVDEIAPAAGRRPVVLVVGGGTVGSGLEALYDAAELDVAAFDIYPSRNTQFVADAHRMPLATASVDALVIQAVLEHVLDPWRVAAEIHRVLRPGGLVYADTPFLQQVHEGPYDFTRFTESGHRWLFRNFELIESGVVAGVGEQLVWSLSQTARTVVPARAAAAAVRLVARPFARLVDRFGSPAHAIDGASSVYFYGRRADAPLAPREMIAHYRGAQRAIERRV
jgi:SAM-dependent methyltransferase